jgi:FAD synthase
VAIDLIERLRGQAVFASVADLQSHMAADVSATRQRLAAPGPSGG